jgi:hypothetical protein
MYMMGNQHESGKRDFTPLKYGTSPSTSEVNQHECVPNQPVYGDVMGDNYITNRNQHFDI